MNEPIHRTNDHKMAAELQEALDGGKGALDCWLEATSEADARVAILALTRRSDAERRLFAAMAMQGSLGGTPGSHLIPPNLAKLSVEYADALLAALELSK